MPRFRENVKSEVEMQRALIGELMGNTNVILPQGDVISDFRDSRICRRYLSGLCPHDLFTNTKMDLGPCDKIHNDDLRDKYEASVKAGGENYDDLLERSLQHYVNQVDRKIETARYRIESTKTDDTNDFDIELNPEYMRLDAEMQVLTNLATEAGDDGDVDKAQDLMASIDKLQAAKDALKVKHDADANSRRLANQTVNDKLRVCDVCSAYLSIFDSDQRLADHFGGKMHVGYQIMRDRLKELRALRLASQKPSVPSVPVMRRVENDAAASVRPNQQQQRLEVGNTSGNGRSIDFKPSSSNRRRDDDHDDDRRRSRRRSRSRSRRHHHHRHHSSRRRRNSSRDRQAAGASQLEEGEVLADK